MNRHLGLLGDGGRGVLGSLGGYLCSIPPLFDWMRKDSYGSIWDVWDAEFFAVEGL